MRTSTGLCRYRWARFEDLRREGGREEQGLPVLRGLVEDLGDVVAEAHVEHLVGLVEDREPDRVEREGAAVEVVEDAPGRADHDLHPLPEGGDLPLDLLAAVDREHRDPAPEPGELEELLGHLDRELARRAEDHGLDAAVGRVHALDDGEAEGGRLAGPGLGLADHVAAGEGRRHGLLLDRGRLLEPELLDGPDEGVGDAERSEAVGLVRSGGGPVIAPFGRRFSHASRTRAAATSWF